MYYNKTVVCDWFEIVIVNRLNLHYWSKSVSYKQIIRIYANIDYLDSIKSAVIRPIFTLLLYNRR